MFPQPEESLELMAEHVKLVADLWLVPGNRDMALMHLQETHQRLLWAKQDARTEAPNDQRPNTLRV
jgi:hypothetical protein